MHKKSYLFIILFLSFGLAFSMDNHTSSITKKHYIIFGDSLSDIGNYPEPKNVNHPTLENYNLYVPITNPVAESFYGSEGTPSKQYLEYAIGTQGSINQKKRNAYSINWVLYFLYAKQNQTAHQPEGGIVYV